MCVCVCVSKSWTLNLENIACIAMLTFNLVRDNDFKERCLHLEMTSTIKRLFIKVSRYGSSMGSTIFTGCIVPLLLQRLAVEILASVSHRWLPYPGTL